MTETYSNTFTQSITNTKATTVGGNVTETYEKAKTESVTDGVSESYGSQSTEAVDGKIDIVAGDNVEIEGKEIHLNKDS